MTLRFGIVGCGRVVLDLHVPAWSAVPDAECVALCDASPAAVEAVGVRVPSARRYTDLERFLGAEDDLDFVVLATPGSTHRALGERILRRGLDVLCEKPLATTHADAVALAETASKHGASLAPIQNHRFRDPAVAALAGLAEVGGVERIHVRHRSGALANEPAPWMREERKHRVLLFDFGVHFVDLALALGGRPAGVRYVERDLDEAGLRSVHFGLRHSGGALTTVELTRDSPARSSEVDVIGRSGAYALSFYPDGFRRLPEQDTPVHRALGDARRAAEYGRARAGERVPGRAPARARSHARLFAAYAESRRLGNAPPVRLEEALETLRILEEVAARAYADGEEKT